MTAGIHLVLAKRHLLNTEALLSELDSHLAQDALNRVHTARLSIETLIRLEERELKGHALGDRS